MKVRSTFPMQTAKTGYLVLSGAMCVLGICLMLIPDFSAVLLSRIFGILLILFGIVRLVGYFSRDLYRLAFQHDLAFGILMAALGTIMLVRPAAVLTFLCITMGLTILFDGLLKIQVSLEARRFGLSLWWLVLALAITASSLGFLLILHPADGGAAIMALLGINLLAEGILNISTVLSAVKIVRHQRPDILDMEDF